MIGTLRSTSRPRRGTVITYSAAACLLSKRLAGHLWASRASSRNLPSAARRPLHQPDDSVLIAVPTINDARHIFVDVVEQVEVVANELHLKQRLIDRDGDGVVKFLPHH